MNAPFNAGAVTGVLSQDAAMPQARSFAAIRTDQDAGRRHSVRQPKNAGSPGRR